MRAHQPLPRGDGLVLAVRPGRSVLALLKWVLLRILNKSMPAVPDGLPDMPGGCKLLDLQHIFLPAVELMPALQ